MAAISIRNVNKAFASVHVLKNIGVEIRDGEFLALVGPSGCGKSTLLRMISGLDPVTTGEIWIGGKNVTDLPAKARDIAMVFQSYALYPHMTVAQNMGFSLRLRGERRAVIEERVRTAAAMLGLSEYLNRRPLALSGGQRQRVAMGRAIVRSPQVFLFDEPLSNLDAKLRVAMRTEIKALHQRLRTTTVYVTHDQVEAMTMADRIAVLRGGIVEQIGTPVELFDTPVNTFVAEFIGSPSMNLFKARVRVNGDQAWAVLASGAQFDLGAKLNVEAEQEVVVGIRPEHFEPAVKTHGFEARVNVVELLGSQMQLSLQAGNDHFTAVINGRIAVQPGDVLNLAPQGQHLHVFDAQSGRRMAVAP